MSPFISRVPRSASIARSQVWLGLPTGRFQSGGTCWIAAARARWWSSWGKLRAIWPKNRRRLLVTMWESGEKPVVPLTSAFHVRRVYTETDWHLAFLAYYKIVILTFLLSRLKVCCKIYTLSEIITSHSSPNLERESRITMFSLQQFEHEVCADMCGDRVGCLCDLITTDMRRLRSQRLWLPERTWSVAEPNHHAKRKNRQHPQQRKDDSNRRTHDDTSKCV